MKKIIVEAEVSLDGVVNNSDIWLEIFKYHGEDVKEEPLRGTQIWFRRMLLKK